MAEGIPLHAQPMVCREQALCMLALWLVIWLVPLWFAPFCCLLLWFLPIWFCHPALWHLFMRLEASFAEYGLQVRCWRAFAAWLYRIHGQHLFTPKRTPFTHLHS